MSYLAKDFLIAASKAAKTELLKQEQQNLSKKRMVKIKKALNLKKELERAERTYDELKDRLKKRDLKKIERKINQLKARIYEEKEPSKPIERIELPEEGLFIEPPTLEDLEEAQSNEVASVSGNEISDIQKDTSDTLRTESSGVPKNESLSMPEDKLLSETEELTVEAPQMEGKEAIEEPRITTIEAKEKKKLSLLNIRPPPKKS